MKRNCTHWVDCRIATDHSWLAIFVSSVNGYSGPPCNSWVHHKVDEVNPVVMSTKAVKGYVWIGSLQVWQKILRPSPFCDVFSAQRHWCRIWSSQPCSPQPVSDFIMFIDHGCFFYFCYLWNFFLSYPTWFLCAMKWPLMFSMTILSHLACYWGEVKRPFNI